MGLARSLSECCRVFLQWLSARAKPLTVNFYRIYLVRFVSAMDDKPIDAVRRLDVECWTTERNPLVCITRFFR